MKNIFTPWGNLGPLPAFWTFYRAPLQEKRMILLNPKGGLAPWSSPRKHPENEIYDTWSTSPPDITGGHMGQVPSAWPKATSSALQLLHWSPSPPSSAAPRCLGPSSAERMYLYPSEHVLARDLWDENIEHILVVMVTRSGSISTYIILYFLLFCSEGRIFLGAIFFSSDLMAFDAVSAGKSPENPFPIHHIFWAQLLLIGSVYWFDVLTYSFLGVAVTIYFPVGMPCRRLTEQDGNTFITCIFDLHGGFSMPAMLGERVFRSHKNPTNSPPP